LGIGDWGLGPIPNPQSPIPKSLITLTKIATSEHKFSLLINSKRTGKLYKHFVELESSSYSKIVLIINVA